MGGGSLLLGEPPLRDGAAAHRLSLIERGGGCCSWGGQGSRAARDCSIERKREEEAASGGASAAQGCSIQRGKRSLFLGELPLRGAARLRGRRIYDFLGAGSRCTGLLD